jgi:hypothetical protein
MPHSAASSEDALNRTLFAASDTPSGTVQFVDPGLLTLEEIQTKVASVTVGDMLLNVRIRKAWRCVCSN